MSEEFNTELNYIKNEKYRKSAEELINDLPDYFFKVPASTTGKYHPDFSLGNGGLVRHTKVAVRIASDLLSTIISDPFTDSEKDLMILSLLIHDGLKLGNPEEKYTRFDHPILISNYVKAKKTNLTQHEKNFICNCLEAHMGQFNTNPYSSVVLPIPKNKYQKFVHMCDYLSSRKYLNVKFNNNEIEERVK